MKFVDSNYRHNNVAVKLCCIEESFGRADEAADESRSNFVF
jgi:hypothetical protein